MHGNIYPETRELLLGHLSSEEIQQWLIPLGFRRWQATYERLRRLAEITGDPIGMANLLPYLLVMLGNAPTPERVLISLERFFQRAQHPDILLHTLSGNLRGLEILIKLFAGSQFLTEILLHNPEYLNALINPQNLAQPKTVAQLNADLRAFEHTDGRDLTFDHLRRFQRRELLRIGGCDLLDLLDMLTVTVQLSNLADCLVRACLNVAATRLSASAEGFVVLAMGKLGGRELNYSSDIDLLFLAQDHTVRYQRLGELLIEGLSKVTGEGFLYRVDMRLRPWGRSGPLVTSTEGYLAYLDRHARLWEKQAMLKARPVAGSVSLGRDFLERAEDKLFGIHGREARDAVSAMKARTEATLSTQGGEWGEVKLGRGSIRDVEFTTQFLQLKHGAEDPSVRSSNTLEALQHLRDQGYLEAESHRILTEGYVFLRTVEHYLQMMHYQQTHMLPKEPDALRRLGRRLGFEGHDAGDQFVDRYEQHRAAVRNVYLHHLGDQPMTTQSRNTQPPGELSDRTDASTSTEHRARMDASYGTIFSDEEIQHHAMLASQLDRDHLVEVTAHPLEPSRWEVTVVAYDYPGELSLICGLLFAHGFSIESGHVFTYEPTGSTPSRSARTSRQRETQRKIVDTFTVQSTNPETTMAVWHRYSEELTELLRMMQAGNYRESRGALAKRVAAAISSTDDAPPTLYPVDIEIDNQSSETYTVLRISAPDTLGFLYEITNALAYNHIYIARMSVSSSANRAQDTLYVTDANDDKITDEEALRKLRAAVVLIKHVTHLLPKTPDPETALLHFREFVAKFFQQPDWPDELASLENPEVLNALARLLGVSEFLWDDFLRMQYANLYPIVRDMNALDTMKTRPQLQAELEAELEEVHQGPQIPSSAQPWHETLNAFKDREMFRIDMRHILGHTEEFWDFSEELTALAEVVVNAAYHLIHEDLRRVYGDPLLEDGTLSDMAVCALGKCGGQELGFASDIELMFVYNGNGRTRGPDVITTAEFYEKLVQLFLNAIRAKREGIFEIDLRLRPYGESGSMAVALESFKRYYAPDGPAWAYERQALVKLRPIAGNPDLGQSLVELRDRCVYDGTPFDVKAMRAMRERQIRHLVTGGTFNAKYSPGGLVDVEYLVQGLQINHGTDDPDVRQTNIRAAMQVLAEKGILSGDAYRRLRRAHTFLRWLIDGLRMVRGNAKDLTVPPVETEAFAFLARRLRYGDHIETLHKDLIQHTTAVQKLNQTLLGS
jgi:glutamate-ammonia-ligase adenylyltransferase